MSKMNFLCLPRKGRRCGRAATVGGLALALSTGLALLALGSWPAKAAPVVACGGAAMQGGAQLMCSHTDPDKPAQFCTFSWDLMTAENGSQIVQGSFLIPPGAANVQVYQGAGFVSAVTEPIVICRGKKSDDTSGDD
jgi:hypothetical protein